MSRKNNLLLILALILSAVFVIQSMAYAAIDKVRCIPWQGDIRRYHTAIKDQAVTLRAVITTTNADQIEYKWVFGDGNESEPVQLSGQTKYNIETDHNYTGITGTPYTAQLVVSFGDNGSVTDNYLVKIEDDSIDARINIAIDKALWRLYLNMTYSDGLSGNYRTFNNLPCAAWSHDGSFFASPTGSVIQAFMINNHKETGNFSEDPYAEAVDWGLNWLFNGYYSSTGYSMLNSYDVSSAQAGEYAEDYDNDTDVDTDDEALGADGNGIGVRDYGYNPCYQGGMIMDAIISTGTPNADTGRDFDGDGTNDTYKEVVQDMADMYSWGQNNPGYGEGSWRYGWDYGSLDNSAAQWGAIGIIPAVDEWGCYVPQWVKTRNNTSLNNSYTTFGANNEYARFGYSSSSCHTWSGSGCHATTPSGMVMMIMDGFTTEDKRWIKCEQWFADTWETWLNQGESNQYIYGMFAFAKAMRLAKPNPIETFSSNGFNWYYGGVPLPGPRQGEIKGLAGRLLETQKTDGSWEGYVYAGNYDSGPLITSWGIIMLKPALFRAAPIACFTANPNPTYADRDVIFDPFCSGHSETGKGLINLKRFDWDWNNDGTYDQTTFSPIQARHSFPCEEIPCSYPVKLRVTDDEGLSAVTTQNVDITNPPHPPVAISGGPYIASLCPGDSLILDGSASFDPNEGEKEAECPDCPPDRVTAWDWDLKGPQLTEFDDEHQAIVTIDDLSNNEYFDSPGIYNIALRVTDNTAASFPGSERNNLTDIDFTSVDIYESCICDITADPGCNSVYLSWTPVEGADQYVIYRSIKGKNNGFVELTTTTGTNIRVGLNREVKNYFRVMAITGDDKCLSKAVDVEADQDQCHGNMQVSAGKNQQDYVMVSFPIECDNPDAVNVLGLPVNNRNLRMGTYDPNYPPPNGTGGYIEYGKNLNIDKGRAYFVLSRLALDILANCNPASLEEDIEVPLWFNANNNNGWNQIGPPNESDYKWENIQVLKRDDNDTIIFGPTAIKNLAAINDYIDKKLWEYKPDGTYDPNTTILRVKKGYFMKVKQANVSLVFPQSAQLLVDASNHETLFARLWDQGKSLFTKFFLTPEVAVAVSDDYPPMPMGNLAEEKPGASAGGCFIEAANDGFPLKLKPVIFIIMLFSFISVLGIAAGRKIKSRP